MQVTFVRLPIQRFVTTFAGILLIPLLASCHPNNPKVVTMQPSILDSTEEQLEKAQAKITFLGEQTKPIATVVFHTANYEVDMKDFAKQHRTREPYTNDGLPYTRSFSVTPLEFSEIVRSLKPILSNSAVAQGPDFLSFTVVRKDNSDTEGHEFTIGSAAGKRFFQSILEALRNDNESGRRILQKQFTDVFPQ